MVFKECTILKMILVQEIMFVRVCEFRTEKQNEEMPIMRAIIHLYC